MSYSIPPDNVISGNSGHIAAHNNLSYIVRNVSYSVFNCQNTTYSGGADPTGASDSTSAINAALTACSNAGGGTVYLPAGTYKTTAPLIIPPGVALVGDRANEVATYLDATYGTVIKPSASWSHGASAWNGIISILNQTSGGYSVTSEEQKIYGLMLDCHLLQTAGTSTTTDGIQFYGGVARAHIENVLVAQPPQNGVGLVFVSGSAAGALRAVRVNVRYAGGFGFLHDRGSDATYVDCLTENCTSDGYSITNLSNGVMIGCRAEHNGGNGFTYVCTNSSTGSGTALLSACTTDRNEDNGIEIFSSNNSGVPVQLAGCRFRRDGRNGGSGGGSFAGIYVHAYPSIVQMSGTTTFPGVSDSGTETNSPDIGLRIHSNSGSGYVVGAACYFQGANQGKADDGTSAAVTFAASYKASGTTGSPTVTPA